MAEPLIATTSIVAGGLMAWFGVHYWRDTKTVYPGTVVKSVLNGKGLPVRAEQVSYAGQTEAQLAADQTSATTDSGAVNNPATSTGGSGGSGAAGSAGSGPAVTPADVNANDLTATAPGTSVGDGTNAQNWAAAYLTAIGAPLTTANIESMIDWFAAEDDDQPTGGNATGVGGNNPLDLAAGYGDAASYVGVTGTNDAGGQALENFATPADGVANWANAITTGPYSGIVAALKSGQGLIGNTSLASEFLNYSGNGYDGLPAAYSGGPYS